MTTITSTELGAAGRYINLGSPAALDDTIKTIICYCRPTSVASAGFGYIAGKTPSASVNGIRLFVSHNSGSPLLTLGDHSTTGAGAPSRESTSAAVTYNSWQHLIGTLDLTTASADMHVLVDGTSVDGTGTNGSGSRSSDAANDLFLMNRGNSGSLARELIGDVAYWAFWNRVLDSTAISNVIANGPLDEPTGLICVVANDQVYSGEADAGNTITISARSTRVTGSLPPNTALGGGGGGSTSSLKRKLLLGVG